ncbi:MAG: hypothetical protein DMG54_16680 [Acidobacteria bacterium]|nr:MAG: hypothetical protein DMG54_16680 [Acidobacteriota bacterium]
MPISTEICGKQSQSRISQRMPILRALTSAGYCRSRKTTLLTIVHKFTQKKRNVQSIARRVRLPHDLFVDFGPGPQYPEGALDMLSGDRSGCDGAHLD